MKKKSNPSSVSAHQPGDDEIRDYAYHLYQQNGCVPGHDLENWLEAKACLEANIPQSHTRARMHRHRHPQPDDTLTVIAIETEMEPLLEAILK
jgi:hypothetical protein